MPHAHLQTEVREEVAIKTILAVEEDEGIGEILQSIVALEINYHLHLFNHPSKALQAIQTMAPHLLLLDFHLPSIDGLELYDLMKILTGGETIPTIILSNDTSPYLMEGSKERGIVVVEKPFEMEDLLHRIEYGLN